MKKIQLAPGIENYIFFYSTTKEFSHKFSALTKPKKIFTLKVTHE